VDEGLTSWVIGRGDAVCANDVTEGVLSGGVEAGLADARDRSVEDAPGREPQNIIVVPLRVHGEVVGSLNLARVGGPETHFGEPEFELCKLFAGQASIALQNAEAHVTVSTRADLDALTGLRNHGTFQRDLDSLVEAGEPFALLMMDLDSFKAFNDTFGHPAGDALLGTVAKAIVGATRQNDRAYRYGGDEFAVLLAGTSGSHATEVAGRVRVAVRDAVGTSHPGAADVRFGVSIGAAHWPADGPAKADLVGAADAALYEAKRRRDPRGH
jgi:diguanylate cyclase (GGDEF)-like protein